MKYRFLKMALAMGLVTSSSIAIAEGGVAYRQPLQGVDANPTFGMTESEKQEYLDNVEMCSNEKIEIINQTFIAKDSVLYKRGGALSNPSTYAMYKSSDPQRVEYSIDKYDGGLYNNFGNREGSSDGKFRMDESVVKDTLSYSTHTRYYFKIIANEDVYLGGEESKTTNYDWCKDNGFKTAN